MFVIWPQGVSAFAVGIPQVIPEYPKAPDHWGISPQNLVKYLFELFIGSQLQNI